VKSDESNGEGYGKQRLWCSVSWGFVSFLSGIIIDKYGIGVIFSMSYFWAFLLVLTVVKGLPSFSREKREEGGVLGRFVMLKRFMAQPKMRSFFTIVFVYSILWYMVEVIPIIQLEEMGSRMSISTRSVIGTAILASTLPEFPIFYYEKYFTNNFTPRGLFMIAHVCTILRYAGYILVTIMDSPWLILPFQALHGGTFAIFWMTTMKYTHSVCPPELRGSVQGCLSTVATIAQAISSMFWGEVYENFGPSFTYSLGIVLLIFSATFANSVLLGAAQPAPLYKVLSQHPPRFETQVNFVISDMYFSIFCNVL
jgi:PPP family 3-phenylpropionic acid transporter